MSKIPTVLPANVIDLEQYNSQKKSGSVGFDTLLVSSENRHALIGDFIDSIAGSKSDGFGELLQHITAPKFPFTTQFESTFGITGPLPVYINYMSQKLNLTAAQNQAFQEIAIRNKDITKTADNVQKIGRELKQAGIGY